MRYFLLFLINLSFQLALAQEAPTSPVGSWIFHPNYTLDRNAKNYPGPKLDTPQSQFQRFKTLGEPIIFYEQNPTERLADFLPAAQIPKKEFSVEFWLLNHVNLPIGSLITIRSKNAEETPTWVLGYYGDEISFTVNFENQETRTLTTKIQKGWKDYWGHLLGTFDGKKIRLYFNGELKAEADAPNLSLKKLPNPQIELAAYLNHEPAMQMANLVKAVRLYPQALSLNEIQIRLKELQNEVEAGRLFPEIFHFNAGPYLHFATQSSINIVWETDRLAQAAIEYGTSKNLDKLLKINNLALIQEITIPDLEANTLYYYQIKAIDQAGKTIESGVLTFNTAVKSEIPFSFCVVGDTESRPHVNHRLGQMIWEERPNFLLHLGDITDGGFKEHKFEWNHEYFTGITPLASRIPVFPVPGNGEADLYWYKRYHRLPDDEEFYKFTYGNADFFMLNTNVDAELKKGGKQYDWLKQKLANSKTRWKFVVHHHCPFSSDENDFGDTWKGEKTTMGDPKFEDLKKLYEEMQVNVVFYGHVHAYERTHPLKEGKIDQKNGVVYIKSGGGGGHLEDFSPTHAWFSGKTQRGNHYCKVDIVENVFTFKMYDLEGRLKDFFELKL
jgi:predicted phosphodiesterase